MMDSWNYSWWIMEGLENKQTWGQTEVCERVEVDVFENVILWRKQS